MSHKTELLLQQIIQWTS